MAGSVPLQGVFKELIHVVSIMHRSDTNVHMTKWYGKGEQLKLKAEADTVMNKDSDNYKPVRMFNYFKHHLEEKGGNNIQTACAVTHFVV
jgi:hypothetical protein